jgi:hypothetical protein
MPELSPFDHIRQVVEGQRIVRVERVFFDDVGLPGHNEVHLELDNGVTIALTSTGVQIMRVPIADVQTPALLRGK